MSNAAINALVKQHSSPPPKGSTNDEDGSTRDRSHSPVQGVRIISEDQAEKSPRSLSPESSLDSPMIGSKNSSAVLPSAHNVTTGGSISKEPSLSQLSAGNAPPSETAPTEDDYGDDDWED